MTATLHHISEESPQIYTFFFEPQSKIDYIAGQFIELTVPHEAPDDRGSKRWFTLSSSPTDDYLSITTRITADSSSFKRTLVTLPKGSEVHVSEPMGDFVLPQDVHTPLVFVAAGIGVTPFHSMFRWLHAVHQHRDIKFIYAVDNEDDIIFQDTFDEANIHATLVVAHPSDAWGGERGKLTADHILKLSEAHDKSLIYLAGPDTFVESLAKDLKELKVSPARVVVDYFQGYEKI